MLLKNHIIRFIALGVIVLSFTLTGCAAKKVILGDPETGLILRYNIEKEQSLNYKRSSETSQSIEMIGQAMETTTETGSDYTIMGVGSDDQNNIVTQVTINDLTIRANSPQGAINPDTSALKGKSFGVIYSTKGKEIEVSGMDELPKISMGQPMAQPQSAETFFSNLLPLLPDEDLKIGDTWSTPIDTVTKQGPIEMSVKGETASVLEGLETVQGMDCIRIKSDTKSTVEGSGNTMEQDIKITGNIKATSTSFFAYKKGIFVKRTIEQYTIMKINLGAMGEMPQTGRETTIIELVQ